MKIAITGGIGTGKSTVINHLKPLMKDYIFASIDSAVDNVYNFKEPPNSTYSEIMNFLNVLGIHTKKEMSNIFFSNPAIKDRFEKLINPIILDVLSNWLENTNIIVEFPLLFRNDFEYLKSKFDLVISITADVETRKARIRFRNNFSDEKIEAIFNSQPDQKYVDVHSDIVFENHIHNIETRKQSIVQLKNIIDQKESQILQIRPEFVAVKDEKIGFVPGSFDPIQRGHLYVIQKALSLVDSVIVVIAHNDSKIPRFNSMEKSRMIKESIIEVLGEDAMSRVRVDFLKKDELLITHAKWCNAKFLFRGLRSGFDYDYEHSINAVQKDIDDSIETIFIMTPSDMSQVSSSLVKSLARFPEAKSALKKYVTKSVMNLLQEK